MTETLTLSENNLEEVMKKLNLILEDKIIELSGFDEIQNLNDIDYEKSIKYRAYEKLTIIRSFSSCLSRFGSETEWETPYDRGILAQVGDEICIYNKMIVCTHQLPSFSPRKVTILEFDDGTPPEIAGPAKADATIPGTGGAPASPSSKVSVSSGY